VSGTAIRDTHDKIIGDLVVISDVTRRQQEWDVMVKSEEKYRVLAETSADGVFTTDPLGRLTYVNPSLERIFGRRKSHILATLFRNYLSEGSVYYFQQVFLDVRKQNKPMKNVELEVIHNDGYEIPIEVNIAPLEKDGTFAGLEGTVRDVTERKKIERELKKSEQLKTEFMNIAAHELKSPVTPIKGYLELIITDKDVNEKIKNWARISYRNAERLLNLVNDILDVSRLDSDTMRFTMEKIDPVDLLRATADDMRLAMGKKNLKFVVSLPHTLPPILGDTQRLSQVMKNLLTNAIKFTDIGSITIRAKKQGETIQIAVEDTGIGISKDELKKIFTKFYQAYTGPDRKNEGAGLGLFICKEIVKKHNGDISVKSDVGKGTTFTVSLPILP
jgi:PAS domain S-box-containing protein